MCAGSTMVASDQVPTVQDGLETEKAHANAAQLVAHQVSCWPPPANERPTEPVTSKTLVS